jgi:hypothetical protein
MNPNQRRKQSEHKATSHTQKNGITNNKTKADAKRNSS